MYGKWRWSILSQITDYVLYSSAHRHRQLHIPDTVSKEFWVSWFDIYSITLQSFPNDCCWFSFNQVTWTKKDPSQSFHLGGNDCLVFSATTEPHHYNICSPSTDGLVWLWLMCCTTLKLVWKMISYSGKVSMNCYAWISKWLTKRRSHSNLACWQRKCHYSDGHDRVYRKDDVEGWNVQSHHEGPHE
jgi:hypothetical protein